MNAGTNSKTFSTSTLADGDVVSCDITVDPGYACTLTDNASSNNIAVTVVDQAVPAAIVQVTGNDVCAGNNINFTVTAQNAGTSPSYQWMVNDQPANNTSTSFSSNTLKGGDRVHCVLTPGQGTCSNAPASSNTIVSIVHPLP